MVPLAVVGVASSNSHVFELKQDRPTAVRAKTDTRTIVSIAAISKYFLIGKSARLDPGFQSDRRCSAGECAHRCVVQVIPRTAVKRNSSANLACDCGHGAGLR